VISFFTLSTIPGKLVSSLLEATSSAEGKSTYRMFVLAGNSSCTLNKGRKYGIRIFYSVKSNYNKIIMTMDSWTQG